MNSDNYLGSFKYEGKLVEGGIMDARAGARVLSGIDSSLKFFISQERPDLVGIQIPIPVKVQEGSWEALIPNDIFGWIKGVGGVAITSYLYAAAKKLAENDLKDKGIKDVAVDALRYLQWLIRTGKHLGHLAIRNLKDVKWDRGGFIGIVNDAMEVLYIPVSIYKRLIACPKNILADLASVIEIERSLKISIFDPVAPISVEITRRERYIFYDESDDSDFLFPELVHGQIVELAGVVTRGNEMSNTIGFLYKGHILTAIPRKGSIVRYKRHLFLSCIIRGEITRADRKGNVIENRPRLIFDDLQISHIDTQLELNMPETDED